MARTANATIEELYKVADNGKAEVVKGALLSLAPAAVDPNDAAGEIFASLRAYARRRKTGRAVTDNAGFKVNLPQRESFSPDAAFYTGETKA